MQHRPVSRGVVSQTPLLSDYRARANSLKIHGFLSSTYLTLHPAESRDVMLFHVGSGLFLALLRTLNQTDFAPYKFHGSYLSGSGRVTELAFMGFLFFLLRNVMSAISVAQACRVAELAFMGFLFCLLRNVMTAISVAKVHRVTELAFMGFLFFLLRNVMTAISVAKVHRVTELAFMGFLFFLLRNVMTAISVAQARRVAELVFMTFMGEISLIQSHGQC